MIDEFRTIFALFAQALIELQLIPFLDPLRLGLWKARTHRKFGFRKEKRLAVIASAFGGVVGISHNSVVFNQQQVVL